MKILFVIPTLTNGGAERAMSNITTHLPDGVEADLLLNSVSDQDYPTDANIISLGMKSVINKNLLYQIIAAVKRTRSLKKLKKTRKYDACISFMDSANICNIISGNRYCKVVVSVRALLTKTSTWYYKGIVIPLDKMLYNKADRVVAVSRGIAEDLADNLHIKKNKTVTITNGFDIGDIQMKSHERVDFKEYENSFNYITLGRYSQAKGQWHLIRAFRKVVERADKKVRLIIMGSGELKGYLQNVIEANNLHEEVTLMPYRDNPYAIMSRCDVFILPSLNEGYSNVLCEAIICGLPCIASDFRTSAREILAPDTDYRIEQKEKIEEAKYGWLVPVCSGYRYHGTEPLEKAEEILAEAMINAHSLQKRKIKSEKGFDIIEKVSQYIELI